MIIGVGIDVVDQQRIEQSIARFKERFLTRIFTAQEASRCNDCRHPVERFAGRFAAKEAFMKAIGRSALRPVTFVEIEVLNRASGAPYIVTHGTAKMLCEQLGVQHIHLSLTHSAGIAAAVVILEV
jgi:holo-[acyl-carrier protein] synthase